MHDITFTINLIFNEPFFFISIFMMLTVPLKALSFDRL